MAEGTSWKERPEAGAALGIRLLMLIGTKLNRRTLRALLYPTVLYFYFVRAPERRASRAFLRRTLRRPVYESDVLRHFLEFARVAADRLYLLTGKSERLPIQFVGSDQLRHVVERGKPGLFLTAHFGSFEVSRVVGPELGGINLRIVLDKKVNARFIDLMAELNPELIGRIIDSNQAASAIGLALQPAFAKATGLAFLAIGTVPVIERHRASSWAHPRRSRSGRTLSRPHSRRRSFACSVTSQVAVTRSTAKCLPTSAVFPEANGQRNCQRWRNNSRRCWKPMFDEHRLPGSTSSTSGRTLVGRNAYLLTTAFGISLTCLSAHGTDDVFRRLGTIDFPRNQPVAFANAKKTGCSANPLKCAARSGWNMTAPWSCVSSNRILKSAALSEDNSSSADRRPGSPTTRTRQSPRHQYAARAWTPAAAHIWPYGLRFRSCHETTTPCARASPHRHWLRNRTTPYTHGRSS